MEDRQKTIQELTSSGARLVTTDQALAALDWTVLRAIGGEYGGTRALGRNPTSYCGDTESDFAPSNRISFWASALPGSKRRAASVSARADALSPRI
jgi:hypothetical protein